MMQTCIDPMIDCVFKALFGDPANVDLLISLINELTRRDPPVVWVEIQNPYSPEEFLDDDLRVVDVRARDAEGAQFQIEVQLRVRPWLRARVLYTWADLYQSQLQRGDDFSRLRPVVSIWILRERLLAEDERWLHRFQVAEPQTGVVLSPDLDIHTVELCKWRPESEALAAAEPWLYFLKEARQWTELPAALRSPLMEKAMSVLERFSEKGEDYHRYQARMNFLREQAAMDRWLAETAAKLQEAEAQLEQQQQALSATEQALSATEQALSATEQALSEKDQALSEKDQALSEKDRALSERDQALSATEQTLSERDQQLARLRQKLIAAGLNPDE